MSKFVKILLGIATILPQIVTVVFMPIMFNSMSSFGMPGKPEPTAIITFFLTFIAIFSISLLNLGILIFYMINVFKNSRVDKNRRIFWLIIFFVFAAGAMPVYWYFYIWRDEKDSGRMLPPSDGTIRPSKWYYGLAAILFVAAMVFYAWYMVKFMSRMPLMHLGQDIIRVVAPGKTEVTLSKAGKYNIYNEYKSTLNHKEYDTPKEVSGLSCTLTSKATGKRIELATPEFISSYNFNGFEGIRIFVFNIEQPGKYELSGEYEHGKEGTEIVLSLRPGFEDEFMALPKHMGEMANSTIVAYILFMLAIIVGLTTFIKRGEIEKLLKTS